MRTLLKRLFQFVLILVLLFAGLIALNYFNTSMKSKSGRVDGLPLAGDTITVLNWNIGYAGLGKESDFIADGGENLQPPSVEIVEKNLAGIQNILSQNKSDIFLIQEVSEPDLLNLGVDVLGGVKQALSDTDWFFSYGIRTQFMPKSSTVKHGKATFARVKTSPVEIIRLPNEPTRLNGILQRQYHIQVREFTDTGGHDWVIMNIHLSAFDEGGNIRVQQLERLIEITNQYYKAGKHVVVGGDWNMQLIETDYPNTTKMEDLFWLKKLPYEKILTGWKIITGPDIATVRTNYQPYIKGENYTTIIDGFMVSPNVKTLSVRTIDTEFEYTDHQAVWAEFSAK